MTVAHGAVFRGDRAYQSFSYYLGWPPAELNRPAMKRQHPPGEEGPAGTATQPAVLEWRLVAFLPAGEEVYRKEVIGGRASSPEVSRRSCRYQPAGSRAAAWQCAAFLRC